MQKKIYDDSCIVVTGAAGMIGSAVVKHLNDMGRTNLLLVDDIGTSDKWKNLIGKQFSRLIGIQDLFSFIEGKEREIEAFIHLGACSDTLEKNGSYLLENNYRYSIQLAEYALAHNHRFIYASSAATYGDGKEGFVDDHSSLLNLRPLNLYGFSKHLFDLWVEKQGALDKLVGLKYFNVFGPNENHKERMASMVFKMVPLIEKEGVLRLFKSSEPASFKDGEQCRDFIYVKDAARLTCEFLQNDLVGIFNVGSGKTTSWNVLASHVFEAMGALQNIEYIAMPEDLQKQYQNFTCADMSKLQKARALLGLSPLCQFSMKEAVFDYVREYLLKDRRW